MIETLSGHGECDLHLDWQPYNHCWHDFGLFRTTGDQGIDSTASAGRAVRRFGQTLLVDFIGLFANTTPYDGVDRIQRPGG